MRQMRRYTHNDVLNKTIGGGARVNFNESFMDNDSVPKTAKLINRHKMFHVEEKPVSIKEVIPITNYSKLTEEVKTLPLHHLRRLFKGKLKEYNYFKNCNRAADFDSTTIFRDDCNETYKLKLQNEHQL